MNRTSKNEEPGAETNRIGLCATCVHMRRVRSDRGSEFYLCELSASDPKFPKYPRLPVIQCAGYVTRSRDSSSTEIRRP